MQQREPMQVTKLFLASSNIGKLREYLELARGSGVTIELLPRFGEFPSFEESAPTFAENSVGKALHYSRFADEAVLAETRGKEGAERRARFVCVTAVARAGRAIAVVSDVARGVITEERRGDGGVGYDPIFLRSE